MLRAIKYYMYMSQSSASRGFTLIELLVVIAIIGILSSVVLASLNSGRLRSRDARRVSDLKQLQIALELYYSNCNVYPTTLVTSAATGCPAGTTLGSFIGTIPTDPSTSVVYFYAGLGTGATCSSYHLGAVMEANTAPGISQDADAAIAGICTGSAADFLGISVACNAVAGGTAAPAGTERCYDIKP